MMYGAQCVMMVGEQKKQESFADSWDYLQPVCNQQ